MAVILTGDETRRLITSRYKFSQDKVLVLDSGYNLINDSEASKYFSRVANETASLVGPWIENIRDCDKFARVVACIGMLSHMRQGIEKTGLAMGVFAYTKDNGTGHAINFMLTKVPKVEKINIRLFEPQTGAEVTLSPNEKTRLLWAVL